MGEWASLVGYTADPDIAAAIDLAADDLNSLIALARQRGLAVSVQLETLRVDPTGARRDAVSVSLSRPVRAA